MVKAQLIKAVAETTAYDADITAKVINEFLKQIQNALVDGDIVYLENFGTFRVYTFKEKIVVDKLTSTEIKLPAKKTPEFKTDNELRNAVNNSN